MSKLEEKVNEILGIDKSEPKKENENFEGKNITPEKTDTKD